MFLRRAVLTEECRSVTLDGRRTDLVLRRHPRARRLKLTIDPVRGAAVLTLPPGMDEADGLAFLAKNEGWARRRLEELPDRIDFAPGIRIPFQGMDHRIEHRPTARGGVRVEGGVLAVSGGESHLPRRLSDFLKREAKASIKPLVRDKASRLDRAPGRISVRDQRTRWGSCAANGDLSFSWRLILAPPAILDYVIAHEVSHLVHMDHSPAFWRTVETLHPDWQSARRWLAENGAQLHRIG